MASDTLQLAVVQADLAWEQPEVNHDHLAALLEAHLHGAADLIVLPEMFPTGFSMAPEGLAEPPDGPSVDWMQALATRYDALVLGSVITRDGGRYYNRLQAVGPQGPLPHYDKRHRFTLAGEDRHYDRGNRQVRLDWRGWRICPQVCYDLRFPVWSRRTAALDYDLLVYVANWPEPRSHHWRRLLPARAVENQCYLAASNRVGTDGKGHPYRGDSVVLDMHGEALAALDPGAEGVLHTAVDLTALRAYREKFAFQADADLFQLEGLA